MGRKRNQGKVRRAARAKAREEAGERNNNSQTANPLEQPLSAQLRQLYVDEGKGKCTHGFDPSVSTGIYQFVDEFHSSVRKAGERGERTVADGLVGAKDATMDEFAAVWVDSSQLETAMSFYLCFGTQQFLGGSYNYARQIAAFVRYLEQIIAVKLKQTQAVFNWPKIEDTYFSDEHTLVKFFRHRIPCSCLDEKYEEVKSITKMSMCYNPKCSIPDKNKKVERSKTKYCSRCRCATYCSRECQEADWSRHKPHCDGAAARIAKFET